MKTGPRFTVFGTMKRVPTTPTLLSCFELHHPFSDWKDGHDFVFFEMDPLEINFIGEFGDRHYVGWLDMDDYFNFAR